MAKNVIQQKKRIAHFQNTVNNEGDLSGCLDYVSSIIQSMDSNYNTLHSDCVENDYKRKANKARQKGSSSSNTDFSENSVKFKGKFSSSRKGPLMEKSKKTMKQLKHNRRIPKPRAHLAALPESPVSEQETEESHISEKKKKLKDKKSKLSKSTLSYVRVSDNDTNLRNINCKESKICNPKSVCKKGESIKSKYLCENSASANLCKSDVNKNIKKNSLSDTNALKESENETTDSEYERFVKISKKGLQNKAIKKQKQPVSKSKASSDKPKSRVRKKIRKKYDSDDDDLSSSCNSVKMSSFKKQKITHEVSTKIDTENVNKGSESDVAVNMSIQDSSSVKVTVNSETSVTDRTLPSDEENICSELYEADSSCESDVMLPELGSLMSKGNISEVVSNAVPKGEIPNVSSTQFKDSSNLGKTELNDHTLEVIDLCDSDDCESSEHSTVSASLKQMCSAIGSTTFDLYDSDHKDHLLLSPKKEKCKLMDVAQNIIHPASEDSDLEVIEVINFSKNNECKLDKPVNMHNQFRSLYNFKENENTHSQIMVKNEDLGDACVYKIDHLLKNEILTTDAVYMTNICNEFSQDELIKQSERTLSSEHSKSLKTSSKDGLLNNDDIVILNPVRNLREMPDEIASSISSHEKIKTELPVNFTNSLKHIDNPTVMNTNFENKSLYKSSENGLPVECIDPKIMNIPSTEKEWKIYESKCSNSKSLPLNSSEGVLEGNKKIDKSRLIELYKKEFQAYQEIVQTEASVGASLKLLEIRQAERVKYIRSQVQKYLETSNSSDATLTERQLSTFERHTDSKPSVSSFINLTGAAENMSQIKPFVKEEFLQDLQSSVRSSLANASKIDCDSKPIIYSLDELQNAQMLQQSTVIPKCESALPLEYLNSSRCTSDKKQTLKLLNEKCNVCGKEAMAACQGCAKVFFCSHECGRKFWNDGHVDECGK